MFGFEQLDKSRMWILGSTIAVLAFFTFLLVMFIAHQNPLTYPPDDQSLAAYHDDQCERPVDRGRIVEPYNTLSNVGYAVAGTLIFLRAGSWPAMLLALNLVVLSIMSGLYHGTLGKTPILLGLSAQELDVVWVYTALLALSVYMSFVHVQGERPFRVPPLFWAIAGGLWAIVGVVMLVVFQLAGLAALIALTLLIAAIEGLCFLAGRVVPELTWVVAPLLFLFIPVPGYLMKHSFGWNSDAVFVILVALLVLQLAFIVASRQASLRGPLGLELVLLLGVLVAGLFPRLADGYQTTAGHVSRKLLCAPDLPFLQAHSFWHVLSAAALLLGYDIVTQFSKAQSDRPVVLPELQLSEPADG